MADHIVQTIGDLPSDAIEASRTYYSDHLDKTRSLLAKPETGSLVILLPPAPFDHADWRRGLARDLARAHAPKRANVVAAPDAELARETLAYLRDAPGVTGQYLVIHE